MRKIRYHHWTEEEEQFLRDNYSHMTAKELAIDLDRPVKSVQLRIHQLGLRKNNPNQIFAIYRGEEFITSGTAQECADHLGKPKRSIWYYATPHNVNLDKGNRLIAIRLED
jgi:hypothetical protein